MFSSKQTGFKIEDFDICWEIGSGGVGEVFKAKLKQQKSYEYSKYSEEYYGIKRIKIGKNSNDIMSEVFKLK